MEFEIKKSIIVRAMNHYQSRLEKLKDSEEITLALTRNDINKNLEDIMCILKEISKISKSWDFSDPQRHVLCLSFTSYINDLKKSKSITREKIGKINLKFEETDKEINLAEKIRDEHCPNDWTYIVNE